MYNTDTYIKIMWQVTEVHSIDGVITEWDQSSDGTTGNELRLLSDKESSQQDDEDPLIQVNQLNIKVNFTEPQLVSRNSLDTIRVSVFPSILSNETRYEF